MGDPLWMILGVTSIIGSDEEVGDGVAAMNGGSPNSSAPTSTLLIITHPCQSLCRYELLFLQLLFNHWQAEGGLRKLMLAIWDGVVEVVQLTCGFADIRA